ncbi:MAG: hypothetical protein HDR14_14750 [Lachnospiraceae bacterium]|nr:hypothetical protein [Lachnospiraceae bacterium]
MKNIDKILYLLLLGESLKDFLGRMLLDKEESCRECSARSGCDPDRHGLCRDCSTRRNIFELKNMISHLEEMRQ